MAGSVNPDIFATGGKENDIKIWKVDNMEKPIFSAKNVSLCVLSLFWVILYRLFGKACRTMYVCMYVYMYFFI